MEYADFDETTKRRLAASEKLLNYQPNNSKVLEFHKSNSKTRLLLGGKRSGKTTSGMVEICWASLGIHPFLDYPSPPLKVRVCGVDFNTCKQTLLPMLYEWLPRQAIRKFWADDRILELTNGTLIDMKSYDQDLEKFESVEREVIFMDEEPPKAVYQSNWMRTISKGINGKLIIAATPLHGMCFDEETEILSETGWAKWDNLKLGNNILTFNKDSRLLEWKPIDYMYCDLDYNKDMVHMTMARNFDALVTPNHRWPLLNFHTDKIEVRVTTDLKSHLGIFRRAEYRNPVIEKKYLDELIELIGWVVTDGSLRPKRHDIIVYQSLTRYPENCEKIRRIFRSVFGDGNFVERPYIRKDKNKKHGIDIHFVANSEKNGGKIEEIKKLMVDKQLQFKFLLELTDSQLLLLYNTLLDGDGSRNENGHQFKQKQNLTIDNFQALCVLLGYSNSKYKWTSNRGLSYYDVHISHNESKVKGATHIRNINFNLVPYKGIVWCPHTSNETVVARRNGSIYISSNSWVYSDLYDNPEAVPPAVEHWHMSIYENPHLEKAAIDAILKDPAMKDNVEAAIYGKFFAHTGLVYPMFDRDRHVIKPLEGGKIPDDWLVILGIDPHDRNPHGVVLCGFTKDNNWIVFDEVVQDGTINELVKTIKAKLGRRYPPNLAIIDTSANAPQSLTGRSVREELVQKHGLYLFDAHKDVTAGRLLVSELLDPGKDTNGKLLLPKLYITENCYNLIRQFRNYQWDNWTSRRGEKQDPKEKPMKREDHLMDSLRYVVMSAIKYRHPGLAFKPKVPEHASKITGYY